MTIEDNTTTLSFLDVEHALTKENSKKKFYIRNFT